MHVAGVMEGRYYVLGVALGTGKRGAETAATQ